MRRGMIRVELPFHLRTLARLSAGEVELEVNGPVTQRTVVDAIEARFPMLRGTIRDHAAFNSLIDREFFRSVRARLVNTAANSNQLVAVNIRGIESRG